MRQREALLLRMAADPSHRLVLYVLEVLLNSPDGESELPALVTRLSAAGGLVAADLRALIDRNGHSTGALTKGSQKQNGEQIGKDGLTLPNGTEESHSETNGTKDPEKAALSALSSLLGRYPSLFAIERSSSNGVGPLSLPDSHADTRIRLTESTANTLSASLPPTHSRPASTSFERQTYFGIGPEPKNGPALQLQSPTPPPKFGYHEPHVRKKWFIYLFFLLVKKSRIYANRLYHLFNHIFLNKHISKRIEQLNTRFKVNFLI